MADNTQAKTSGLGIASLVLGIIGVVICAIPIFNQVNYISAVLGAIFAIVALIGIKKGKKAGKGLTIAGLVLNIVAIIATSVIIQSYVAGLNAVSESLNTDQTAATTSESKDASTEGSDNKAEDAASKFEITDETLGGDYFATVTGSLKNNSGEKVGSVVLTYTLFDVEGNQVGTATAMTSDLEADKTWKFEAVGTETPDKVASFKLSSVDAY